MASGNHHKPPPPSSASASAHRKSRWESNNNPAANATSKSPAEPKPNDTNNPKAPPKPSPKTKPNNPNSKPNPSPKQQHPHHPSSDYQRSLNLIHFPDPPALPPPPPPAYGFHMLERRTIILADGSVRSYFALPPDYQHLPPPRPLDLPPFDFRRHPDFPNHPQHEPSAAAKRKYGGRDEDALARQRELLLRNANQNGFSSRGEFSGGGPSELRPSKQLRADGAGAGVNKHQQVDQEKLKKAFLHFSKLINENSAQKKSYLEDGKQGRLQCIACGRSAKDFPDMHALIMHTYNSDNADLHVDHLGLHKALCVLMSWNYSKPPDNSKAYQFLSADEAAANQDDLIMWPPMVIIHNTNTGKTRDGRMEGLGNKAMDNKIRELGFMGGKSKSLYGKDGHLGITLVKFSGDQSGLKEAMLLAEHFEKENHGRKDWTRVQPLTLGKDDENNPNLVKVDDKKGEKSRILYGYLGTAFDLDKVDFDTRRKAVIESRREYKPSM